MKSIQSTSVWSNGETKEAVILDAYAVNVQLNKSATFLYSLCGADKSLITSGNVIMEGDDYQGWDQDTFAWDWIATKLNLVITGDYVE